MKNESSQEKDVEFENLMEQRIKENFATNQPEVNIFDDERLTEMNKKLPAWSLEPPYSFLK